MNTLTRALSVLSGLALLSPLLVGCSSDDAHNNCMATSAAQAAAVEGGDASSFDGDYDLMNLCDALLELYPDDPGRVDHALECIGERVKTGIEPEGIYSSAYSEGTTIPDLMDDPFSIGACT